MTTRTKPERTEDAVALRDARIVRLLDRGRPYGEVADLFMLPVSRVIEIHEAAKVSRAEA